MSTIVQRKLYLRAAIIAVAIALILPVTSMAHSRRRDDDNDRRGNRRGDAHRQLHLALEAEHRAWHQYNRIDDEDDRRRHRKLHQFLESKHRREHRRLMNFRRR